MNKYINSPFHFLFSDKLSIFDAISITVSILLGVYYSKFMAVLLIPIITIISAEVKIYLKSSKNDNS